MQRLGALNDKTCQSHLSSEDSYSVESLLATDPFNFTVPVTEDN